jgi:hypothetical protein
VFTILFDTWYITHACFYHFRLFTFIVYCLTQFAFLFSVPISKPWCGHRVVNTYVWRIAATKPWVHRTDNLNIGPCMDISATLWIHVSLWIHVTLRMCVDRKMCTFWTETNSVLQVASVDSVYVYVYVFTWKLKEIVLLPFFSLFYCAGQQYWCIDVCVCV